MKLETHHW